MKLSEKQIELLDKACLSKFGMNFDSMYKMVESNEELKKQANNELKKLKDSKKEIKRLEKIEKTVRKFKKQIENKKKE